MLQNVEDEVVAVVGAGAGVVEVVLVVELTGAGAAAPEQDRGAPVQLPKPVWQPAEQYSAVEPQ